MDPDDHLLHSLLAEGRLSGAQREAILERALDQPGVSPRRSRLRLVAFAALPVAAAVALAWGFTRGEPEDGAGGFVPKGEAGAVLLRAGCANRPEGVCRSGDRLIFQVDGAKEAGFIAAYADCPLQRVWYFPTKSGALPAFRARAGRQVLAESVRVGTEHGAGSCRLHLFALKGPSDRDAVLSGQAKVLVSTVIAIDIAPSEKE